MYPISHDWMHPIIRKWIQKKTTHRVEFDYCQFDTAWRKPTSVLSVGNSKFHTGMKMKCKVSWQGEISYCSKTKEPHVTLTGFVNGAEKGQYKTNRACPYRFGCCEYVANLIAQPSIHFKRNLGDNPKGTMAMVGPAVSMELPPADHYITHTCQSTLVAKRA